MFDSSEEELRKIVLQLATSLRFDSFPVWQRCDAAWRGRVRRMGFDGLKREMIFLLARCGFRRMARLHAMLFRFSPVALAIVGKYVTNLQMENTSVLSTLIADYRSNEGKYFFLIRYAP